MRREAVLVSEDRLHLHGEKRDLLEDAAGAVNIRAGNKLSSMGT